MMSKNEKMEKTLLSKYGDKAKERAKEYMKRKPNIGRGDTIPIVFESIDTKEEFIKMIHNEFPDISIPNIPLKDLVEWYEEMIRLRKM